MDPELLDLRVQGVSDLQACYNHALSGLIKAGTDLNRVGTEFDRVQVTFYNAIDGYFEQLQLQIDNKDKAIRLMLEQKIEWYDVMSSMQNQLVKLQDENTTLKTKNEYLTGILNANVSGTGNVLPPGMLQENFSDNVTSEVQDRTSSPLSNDPLRPALIHQMSPNRRLASFSNGGHKKNTSEIVPYRAEHKEQERSSHEDEAFETGKKSVKHIYPEARATHLSLQNARERQAVVREPCDYRSGNAEACMQDDIRQEQQRSNRSPAATLQNEINNIIKEQTARERLAEWKNSPIDTNPDATRAFLEKTDCSDVLNCRLQSNEIALSHQGSTAQDSFQRESPSQVLQQQDFPKANNPHQRTGEVNAGPWATYNQESTTEAKESFRRQQAAHGWTVTKDDRRSKGTISKESSEAIQSMGREPKLKAELESTPRKDHSVSVLNPRSPSFVPSNDKRGAAMTGKQTPPHKRVPKPDSLNADLSTALTNVDHAAVNSEARNENSVPPHKRFPVASKAHKTPTLIEVDTDLIALEDEIEPITAIRQYTFKATTREDHALAPLDPNISRPSPTISNGSNGVTKRASASSSLDELRELQTEARSISPFYNAPMDPGNSIKKPSPVWLEPMYKQAHDSSEPPTNLSSPSTSPRAVDSALVAVHGLPLVEKAKGVSVQQKSTLLVSASSPAKSKTNRLAQNTANTTTETMVIKGSANSNSDTPFEDDPFTVAEHKIKTQADSEGTTPIISKAPTSRPPQHFNLPKDSKDMSAAFMAAAQSNFSSFATKYGRDPESDTRKELAAKGRALKRKLANEASTSDVDASLRESEEQYRYPDEECDRLPILGTHDLGGGLDRDSQELVIKANSRGEWFEIDLDWKPVVKDGRISYILR